ncbi:hypothetical protein [Enterobacter phage EC152]|uniref:Uncharacterized protein n=2 Tax=root TaxID=1 RepID=K4FAY8_9CAUD|nr:hypothetical protein [Enterobacter asburiae]YP_006987074.1 hypothetical protein GAP31_238 [Cronobacter phage vB_CsaM_GAP31]AFC21419.1 hypothetical protein GAP31_238 [Cronobacter phage vB_CsaM_GAP31]MBL5841358.1 hypothetical protein [Enterobacter asburiae]
MSKYDTDVGNAWSAAYGAPHSDPHGVFAQLLGVDRNEAKEICYKYMWSEEGRRVFAIDQWHHTSQEGLFIYKFFKDLLTQVGVHAVPSITEILEMREQ